MKWVFVENPPNQTSSDGDWDALDCGYLRPERVLAEPDQIRLVRQAQATLRSFFNACREKGIRDEM